LTLDTVSVSPDPIVGTNTATLTVTLTEPAPAGGLEIDLYHSGSTFIPPFVIVPEGEISADVPVETELEMPGSSIGTPLEGRHLATIRRVWLGVIAPAANFVESFTLATSRTAGGNLVTATVTLYEPAGEGGAEIALESDNLAVGTVPASVTVSEGNTVVTFDIDTDAVVSPADVNVRASYLDANQKARLTVVPTEPTVSLESVSFEWNRVLGPGDTIGTVTLSSAAPAGGIVVTLGGSRAGLATVPASVTVPEGETSADFTITTQFPDYHARYILVTATYDGLVRSAPLQIYDFSE
jgi:hypothetical protein